MHLENWIGVTNYTLMKKRRFSKIGGMNQNTFFRKNEKVDVIDKDGSSKEISTARVGEQYLVDGRNVTVKESCKKDSGLWHCMTHGETFQSQFSKDAHIFKGDHRLLWLCFEHGWEQP